MELLSCGAAAAAGPEVFAAAEPILPNVFEHSRENIFLQQMAREKYAPEFLFLEHPDVVERIRAHPACYGKQQTLPSAFQNEHAQLISASEPIMPKRVLKEGDSVWVRQREALIADFTIFDYDRL